jgi:hypothetical protein
MKRRVFSITSHFLHPDFGMERFEVLSRASAFPVRRNSKNKSTKFHFITSQHVTHPFNFPNYYGDKEFVQHLSDEHVKFSIEIREDDGTIRHSFECKSKAFPHPTRDFAVVHLENEEKFCDELNNQVSEIILMDKKANSNEKLIFDGHFLSKQSNSVSNEDDSKLVPKLVQGELFARSDLQVFAKTSSLLELGMCGCPVLSDQNNQDGAEYCFGVVEGIVPPRNINEDGSMTPREKALQYISGCAVFVESSEIIPFLDRIDQISM